MVNQIEIALVSGADGIITMPIAPEAMRPVFRKCAEQKVPVVFAGAEDDVSTSLAFVGTNEVELGQMGAADLMRKFGGKPIRAHILQSTMDASFAIKARDGYIKAFRDKNYDFQMILNEPCDSDMMIAMERYQNALTAHPEINCIIGVCGEGGPAAAKVVKEIGRPDIVIMAIDDVAETLDFVKSGDIYATMAQNFYKIGYEPAKILYQYLTNGTKPASYSNDSGCTIVTKDNINSYMNILKSK
jgi:ribose transport system substrate-binding protein